MACKKDHSAVQSVMENLPVDQGGWGRHKCAACAYEQGYQDGLAHREIIDFPSILQNLEDSQAQAQRHKSPHAAYALGYAQGVTDSYNN